jgi:chorismate synthase
MMSINACKGFEYGSGFSGIALKGSEMYLSDDQQLISGGIAGGISDGNPIVFRCVFKPTATNRKTLEALHSTLNSSPNSPLASSPKVGRHDACVAVRAVAVVEAMAALVVQDLIPLTLNS